MSAEGGWMKRSSFSTSWGEGATWRRAGGEGGGEEGGRSGGGWAGDMRGWEARRRNKSAAERSFFSCAEKRTAFHFILHRQKQQRTPTAPQRKQQKQQQRQHVEADKTKSTPLCHHGRQKKHGQGSRPIDPLKTHKHACCFLYLLSYILVHA